MKGCSSHCPLVTCLRVGDFHLGKYATCYSMNDVNYSSPTCLTLPYEVPNNKWCGVVRWGNFEGKRTKKRQLTSSGLSFN